MTQKQKAEGRRQKWARFEGVRFLTFCFLLFAFCFPLLAKNGAFKETKHGDPVHGPKRRADKPAGTCIQCHDGHASHDALRLTAPNERGLFAADDNDLCFTCHGMPSPSGVYPGSGPWMQSIHARSSLVVRSGRDARPPADVNKCVNCHDPHGVRDATGVVPAMLIERQPDLCLTCHDGGRGADIRNQLSKAYHHPIGERTPSLRTTYAATNDRDVVCSDCHNVHLAFKDPAPPAPPEASSRLAGVSRVEVVNGGAGVSPTYRARTADDPGVIREYEICFKCHSSWKRLPPGRSDLARLTNPNNPSFHPVQERGRNRNIDLNAFAGGFSEESILLCTDCHHSDDSRIRGPHGSSYPYLLKAPTTSTTAKQAMPKNDICFECHAYEVYAEPASDPMLLRASRFNSPASEGHAFHVGAQRIPCFACHDTHGSTRYPALIASARLSGISSYIQMPSGGTCTSTCHGLKTYSTNYRR